VASSWTWTETRATIRNALWLNTTWAWSAEYLPFAPNYSVPPLSVLKFLLPFSAFSALYLATARSQNGLSSVLSLPVAAGASLVSLFVIILSTGTRPPGNLIFDRLYGLPFGWLLREPGRFLMLVGVAYGILVAVAAERVVRVSVISWCSPLRGLPIGPTTAIVLGTAISLGLDFPIVIGTVVPDARPPLPSGHVRLPEYWTEMGAYIDRAPYDGSVLVTPPDDFYQMPYRWGYYGTDSFIPNLLKRPAFVPSPQGYLQTSHVLIDAVDLTAASLLRDDWAESNRLLEFLGVRLVLVRGDVDATFPGRSIVSPALLRAALERAPSFKLIHVAGPLALFVTSAPMPSRLSTTRSFVTTDSTNLDLRVLPLLPPTTNIVSTPAIPGVMRLSQFPSLSVWNLGGGELRINVAQPAGWEYRVGMLSEDEPPILVDPVAEPDSVHPFLPLSSAEQATPNTLGLRFPLGQNLITDGSFQDGEWQSPVGDCNAMTSVPAGSLSSNLRTDGPNGLPALRLSASIHIACEARDIAWTGGSLLVHFRTRHISGLPPRICVFEIGPSRCAPTKGQVRGVGWAEYSATVSPDRGTKRLGIFLYADGNPSGARTVNDYADVGVYSVPSTELVLLGYPQQAATTVPPLLVLRESYTAEWIGPPGSVHVLVDGMINGWLLGEKMARTPPTYGPTLLVSLAAYLSMGASAAVVVLTMTRLRLKRHRLRVHGN
jgi:arabinofuranan 3-O-arabinosyltransferase